MVQLLHRFFKNDFHVYPSFSPCSGMGADILITGFDGGERLFLLLKLDI